ncbi:MAG: UDP-2,4-diacetamido-2,4,6-trideoxy-beta-L-altropyranose hydrolase [Adhaeribacter sp.]
MMQIYFRCDAGSQIGLGHLVRCLALAQVLRPSFQAHFLVQDPSPDLAALVEADHFRLTVLPATADYLAEAAALCDFPFQPGDLVVLDGYAFTTAYQQLLKQHGVLLVYLDDLQAFPIPADMVINQAGGVDPGAYQVGPQTRLCLGPDYALLRPPFLEAATRLRQLPALERVFLNMGGADPGDDTARILAQLQAIAPQLQVEVVTGSAYRFGETLRAWVLARPRVRLHQQLSATDMCRLMETCQVAILPPSSVAYEWCCVGGPLFLHQTAPNQSAMRTFLLQQHLASEWDNPAGCLQQAMDPFWRENQLQQQKKTFSGKSSRNLLAVFQELYYSYSLELRPAQAADVMTLFEWVNDPAVRANSFSQTPVPLAVHKVWFANKLQDASCLILIAQVKGLPAGMIRYDLKNGQGVISYLLGPGFRGKGLGALLLRKGEQALRSLHPEITTLIGHVQQSNKASMSSFQKNQYQLSQSIPPFMPDAVVFEKQLK